MEQLAAGPTRLSDVARSTGMATGTTAATLNRLGEAVVKRPDGRYAIADPVLALWLRWRSPGGAAVPMRALGDEGERRSAEALAARGFGLVYQSRGLRGSFDLLAIRNGNALGVQVKHRALPVRLRKAELERIHADALAMGIPWVLAAVDPSAGVRFLDPGRSREGARFDAEAGIENLPRWFDEARAGRMAR
jgi:Holliday junction resolvase